MRVLDPFCGTATTALSAAYHGHGGVTTEINPFLVWLGQAKTAQYSDALIASTRRACARVVESVKCKAIEPVKAPHIHNIERWWREETLEFLCALRSGIEVESRASIGASPWSHKPCKHQGNHGATKKPSPEDWNNGKTDDAHRLAARRCSNGSHWRKRWRGHAQHVKKQSREHGNRLRQQPGRASHATGVSCHVVRDEWGAAAEPGLQGAGHGNAYREDAGTAAGEDKGSGNKGTALPGGSGHWPVTRTGSVEKVSPSVAAPFGRGKLLNTVRQGRSIVRQAPLRNPHGGTSGQGETIA